MLLDALEKLLHGQHHDAGVVGVAKHGVRFARARRLCCVCLRVGWTMASVSGDLSCARRPGHAASMAYAVGKHRGVVAVQHVVDKRPRRVLVHLGLRGLGAKDTVKSKLEVLQSE